MATLREYLAPNGKSPFGDWFDGLGTEAAAKVTMALARIEAGNLGDCKPVGQGVMERRIDHGPGYRVYFGRQGAELVILLAGGTKKRQQADITTAQERWADYKRRKRMGA
ncbi:MAG: type II toxin-antitoxin system RelE/ParE family toxin [Dongiaceae bacterium]